MPWNIYTSVMTPDVRDLSPVFKAFKGAPPEIVPVPYEELEDLYSKLTGWKFPRIEMVFASSWMFLRVSGSFSIFFFPLQQSLNHIASPVHTSQCFSLLDQVCVPLPDNADSVLHTAVRNIARYSRPPCTASSEQRKGGELLADDAVMVKTS